MKFSALFVDGEMARSCCHLRAPVATRDERIEQIVMDNFQSSVSGVSFDGSPPAVKDFIFDLHDAMRRSRRDEDEAALYEQKFKELTDKYFGQRQWPQPVF
jgi:hypothetical protein